MPIREYQLTEQELIERLKYTNVEIIELEDEGLDNPELALKKESSKIMKVLNDKDYIITMEIEGKEFRFEDISEAAMLYYGKSLLFTHKEGYFGLTGEHFHAWKEARLYRQYMKETAPNKSMNAL